MTARERIETMVLRQQAVEALGERQALVTKPPDIDDLWDVSIIRIHPSLFAAREIVHNGAGATEADALRALLRDMGVEPWEWPATGCGALIGTPGRETTCGKGGICMGCWRIDNDPTLSMLGIGGES